jgi:hypothetical protein
LNNCPLKFLFELYHLCNQSELVESSQQIVGLLKRMANDSRTGQIEILEFYFTANIDDDDFLDELKQIIMEENDPNDFCVIYLSYCDKHPKMIEQITEWIISMMNEDSSSDWLAAFDEHQIDDVILWENLGNVMDQDTFHLWNIFRNKLSKERDRIDKIEKERDHLQKKLEMLETLEKSTLARLEILEKLLGTK